MADGLSAEEIDDLERAARTLRSAVAAAFTMGMDEDWIYHLVGSGLLDARDWPIAKDMQARNRGRVRPDGADRPPP